MEQHDLVTLASLYHSDAVQLSADSGQVLRGTAAIVAAADRMLQAVGPIAAVSADQFVECGDVLCVEATQALRFRQVQTYDVFVLRAGAVQFQFSGMIAPRPAGRAAAAARRSVHARAARLRPLPQRGGGTGLRPAARSDQRRRR
jgi:hypothetical protein